MKFSILGKEIIAGPFRRVKHSVFSIGVHTSWDTCSRSGVYLVMMIDLGIWRWSLIILKPKDIGS